MDWNAAIEKNREALKRVLAMLAAMAGVGDRQSAVAGRQSGSEQAADRLLPTANCRFLLPRHLYRAVLRLLRPAEAAARRLVIAAARGMEVRIGRLTPDQATAVPSLPRLRPAPLPASRVAEGRQARLAFPLLDPAYRFQRRRPARSGVPRISLPGFSEPFRIPPPPSRDDAVDATRLALRLAALARVLDDLPREAKRFARWRARVAAGAQIEKGRGAGRARRRWPLRPGHPPGRRPAHGGRPRHEVDDILGVTHDLAFLALHDTS